MGMISMMFSAMALAGILFGWFAVEGQNVRHLFKSVWTSLFTRYGWPDRPVFALILLRVAIGLMLLQAVVSLSFFAGIITMVMWFLLKALIGKIMVDNAQTEVHEEIKRCQTDPYLFGLFLMGMADVFLGRWLSVIAFMVIVAAMSLPSTKHDGSRRSFIHRYSTT